MENKNSKTKTVSEFRNELLFRLAKAGKELDNLDRMKIGLTLTIDSITVKRYLENKAGKMSNLEQAEQIAIEAEKIIAEKELTKAEA